VVGICFGAISSGTRLPDHDLIKGLSARFAIRRSYGWLSAPTPAQPRTTSRRFPPPLTSSGGSTVWVLMRRLNSWRNPSWRVCRTTIAFDARIDFHWHCGKRVSLGAPTATPALRQFLNIAVRRPAPIIQAAASGLSRAAPRGIQRLAITRAPSFLIPAQNVSRLPPSRKNVRLFMNCLGAQDRSGHFATAVAFSLFETLLELAQALLQASIGQQDLDNGSKLAWTATADCN
jgi:hypothetical protein